ncbi:MAG TPA: VOC family protein [Mycobacteriales bacterium]|nr:VOC family protein [Mycobacteriales bacterium]
MTLRWFGTVIDSHDPDRLAEFWAEALGFSTVFRSDRMVAIAPDAGTFPGLAFVRVVEPKTQKNRLHLDLRPDDQEYEIDRLLALGAHRQDIGQGAASWAVLSDPEGNEFCVLASWDA